MRFEAGVMPRTDHGVFQSQGGQFESYSQFSGKLLEVIKQRAKF